MINLHVTIVAFAAVCRKRVTVEPRQDMAILLKRKVTCEVDVSTNCLIMTFLDKPSSNVPSQITLHLLIAIYQRLLSNYRRDLRFLRVACFFLPDVRCLKSANVTWN